MKGKATTGASFIGDETGARFDRDKIQFQAGHRHRIEAEVVHDSGGPQAQLQILPLCIYLIFVLTMQTPKINDHAESHAMLRYEDDLWKW